MAALRGYSSNLERRLPPTLESVTRERDGINSQLRRSGVEGLVIGGETRYSDEARIIRNLGDQAVQAMRTGRPEDARRYLDEAEAKMSGLGDVVARQRRLVAAQVPPEVVNAAEAAWLDMGRQTSARGQNLNQALDMYLENRDIFDAQTYARAKQSLFQLIGVLAGGASNNLEFPAQAPQRAEGDTSPRVMSAADSNGILTEFRSLVTEVRDSTAQGRLESSSRWKDESASMRARRFLHSDYRASVDAFHTDATALYAQLSGNQPVDDARFSSLQTQYGYIERADRSIQALQNPLLIAPTSRIYARGLNALRAGQQEAADAQEFLAQEYTRANNSQARRQLEGWSASLESGEMTPAQVRREAGQYLARGIDYNVRRVPADIRGSIDQPVATVRGRLTSQDVSMGDLARGRAMVDLIGNYRGDMAAARADVRAGAAAIYARAFQAAALGLGQQYVEGQRTLANMYINPRDYTILNPSDYHVADPVAAKRAEIEQVSVRFEEATRLRVVHSLVVERNMSPEQAATQVAGAEGAAALARRYTGLGTDAEGRRDAIDGTLTSGVQYIQINATRAELRRRRRELPSGSTEELMYDTPIEFMDTVSAKIARGETPTPAELRAVEGFRVLHMGTPQDMARFFASNPQDQAEIERLTPMFAGVANVRDTIGGLPRGGRSREGAVGIYVMAQMALIKSARDDPNALGSVPALMTSASAYARANNDEDRLNIFDIAMQTDNGTITTDAGTWLARTQLDRVTAESRVTDPGLRTNLRAYYDMAILAYQRRDTEGANAALHMANLYASAAAQDQSNPDVRETMGLVHRTMGDFRQNRAMRTQRFSHLDLPEGDRRRWAPPIDSVNGAFARALIGNRTLSQELAATAAVEGDRDTRFGRVLAVPADRRLEALEIQTGAMEGRMGRAENRARGQTITGRNRAEERRFETSYAAQRARHSSLASTAEARGDNTERDRQNDEAARLDAGRMRGRVGEINTNYEEAVRLLDQAADLRTRALSETGDARDATLAEATRLSRRASGLMQLSESGMSALDGLNGSVMGVRTIQRERGRAQFDRAATTYISVGNEMREQSTDSPNTRQNVRIRAADRDMAIGGAEVARQQRIQAMVATLVSQVAEQRRLHQENVANYGTGRHDEQGNPLPALSVSRTLVDPEGRVWAFNGTPVVNERTRDRQLRNAEMAARAELFPAAQRSLGEASRGIRLDTIRGGIEVRYRGLIDNAPDSALGEPEGPIVPPIFGAEEAAAGRRERGFRLDSTGFSRNGIPVTVGFDYDRYMITAFRAEREAHFGRFAESDALVRGIGTAVNFGATTQGLINDRERLNDGEGATRTRVNTARTWGSMTREQAAAYGNDQSGLAAHRENIAGIRGTGALDVLVGSGGQILDRSSGRRTGINNAIQALVNREDAEGMIGVGNVGTLLDGIFRSQCGLNVEYYERYRARYGDDATFRLLSQEPRVTRAVDWLVQNHRIDATAGQVFNAQMGGRGSMREMADYTDAHAIAISTVNTAIQFLDTTDRYERTHGYGGMGGNYIALRNDAGRLVQVAYAVGADPSGSMRALEEGRGISTPAINIRIRGEDSASNLMAARMDVNAGGGTIPGLLYSSSFGFFDRAQTIGGGTPMSMNENIDRMNAGLPMILDHTEANSMADLYTNTVMGRARYGRDPTNNGQWARVPGLNSDEYTAVMNLTWGQVYGNSVEGGFDNLMQNYLNVTLNLTSFVSLGDRRDMYRAVGNEANSINTAVSEIFNARFRSGGETGIGDGRLGQIYTGVRSARTTFQRDYSNALAEGRFDESVWRATTFVFEVGGSAIIIGLTGGAAAPLVGVYFGTKGLHDIAETSRQAGGWSQVDTTTQVLLVGGTVLGFAGGVFGRLSALGSEARALGEGGTVLRSFAQGGRAFTWGGRVLVGTGGAFGTVGLVQGYRGYMRGETTLGEFLVTGVGGFAQAMLPLAGSFRPTQRVLSGVWMSESTSARFARGALFMLTGETRTAMAHAEALEVAGRFHDSYRAMPEAERTAFRNVERSVGMRLDGEVGLAAVERIRGGANAAETTVFLRSQTRIESISQAYTEFRSGSLTPDRARELGLNPRDIALFSEGGALRSAPPEAVREIIIAHSTEETHVTLFNNEARRLLAGAPEGVVPRARELSEAYMLNRHGRLDAAAKTRLHISGEDVAFLNRISRNAPEAAAIGIADRARTDVREAPARQAEMHARTEAAVASRDRVELSATLVPEVTVTPGQPSEVTGYQLGSVRYTPEHGQAAVDVAAAAAKVRRGTPIEQLGLSPEMNAAVRSLTETRPGETNPRAEEFRTAAESGNRQRQMELALEASSEMPNVRLTPEAADARIAGQVDPLISDQANSPGGLRREAARFTENEGRSRQEAEAHRERAAAFPEGSEQRVSAEKAAQRADAMADASHRASERLTTDADARTARTHAQLDDNIDTAVRAEATRLQPLQVNEGEIMVRAQQLAEAFELGANITPADATRLRLSSHDVAFVQGLSEAPPGDVANRIARYASGDVEARVSPRAAFAPERFRRTLQAEEEAHVRDAGNNADALRGVAEARRSTAAEWDERGWAQADNARRLEIEGASPQVVQDAWAAAGRDFRVAEEYRQSANRMEGVADRVALDNRVNQLVSERGMSPEQAARFAQDEHAAPNVVPLEPTVVAYGEREDGFRGMPREYQTRRVDMGDGTSQTAAEAPRARLIRRIDNTEDSVGSTGGVWEAEITVNGQTRRVAVKVFRDRPQLEGRPPPTREEWDVLFNHAQHESQNLRAASNLGVGPEFYGLVNVDGNIAIAMDHIPGTELRDMTPAQIREFVRPETYVKLGEAVEKVVAAGYIIDDFQFAVVFPRESEIPTNLTGAARRQWIDNWHVTINGREMHAGDVAIWDVGAMARAADRPNSRFTPERIVNEQRNYAAVTLAQEHVGSLTRIATDTNQPATLRTQAQNDLRVLDGFFREVSRSAQPGDNTARMSNRYILTEGRNDVANARLAEIRTTDPARAQAIEAAMRRFESGAGLEPGTLLPHQPDEAVAVPRARAVGDERTVLRTVPDERTVPGRGATRPEGVPTAGPEERTVPAARTRQPERMPSAGPEEATVPQRGTTQPERPATVPGERTVPGRGQVPPERAPGERAPTAAPAEERTAVPRSVLDEVRAGADIRDAIDNLAGPQPDLARRLERRLDPLYREPFGDRFRAASPEERAAVVEKMAQGKDPVTAFREMAQETRLPANATEFAEMGERFRTLPDSERVSRLGDMARQDPSITDPALVRSAQDRARVAEAVALYTRETNPARRARLASDFEASVRERARVADMDSARSARTPQEEHAQELGVVTRMATERGVDPAIMSELYGEGGTGGRLLALDGLGIDVSRFQTESQRIAGMPEGEARNVAQQRLDAITTGFFELVTRGGLEGRIAGMTGFEGATITSVAFNIGARGIYDVTLSNGRHVFVKMEDVAPARLGAQMARNQGLFSSEVHDGFSYDTGLRYRDGSPIRQDFGIIEDIHDAVGRRITIRLPNGSVEEVTVRGVAMLRHEVLEVPQAPRQPAPGASPAEMRTYEQRVADYQQRLARWMQNPAVQEFYRLAGSETGREQFFEAHNAYLEMSRQGLLGDRFARNSAEMLVERANGERVLTTQPIDMDPFGFMIGANPDGTPNMAEFNGDFAGANRDLITRMSRATEAAAIHGMSSGRVGTDTLATNMFSDRAMRGMEGNWPADPAAQSASRALITENDGRHFGVGFDTTSSDMPHVGDLMAHGGGSRPIDRSDGRMTMHADDMNRAYDVAQTPEARNEFIRQNREAVTREFGGGRETPPEGAPPQPAPPPQAAQPPGERTSAQRPGGRRPSQQEREPAPSRPEQTAPDEVIDVTTGDLMREGTPARRTQPTQVDEVHEVTGSDLVPEGERTTPQQRRGVPPPPPPEALAQRRVAPPPLPQEAQAPAARMSPVDLVYSDNLAAFSGRFGTGDANARADFASMPLPVQDIITQFGERYRAAAGNPAEQTRLANEYAGRIQANRLASDPETLMRFATNFRYGVDGSMVTPEARAMFDRFPPSVQRLVLDYAENIRANYSGRRAFAEGYADRVSLALEVETAKDLYAARQAGRPITSPVDRATVDYLTSGGTRTIDPTTPGGVRALEAASRFRVASNRLALRDGPDSIPAARTLGESARTGQRPSGFDAATSYDLVTDLARASANQAGRAAPTTEDYQYAAVMYRYMEGSGLPGRGRVTSINHSSGNAAIEQHVIATVEWGGIEFDARIFRGRVNIGDVRATSIGENAWPSREMHEAVARFAQRRLRGPLERALRDTMGRIPRETGSEYAVWRPVTDSIMGRELDLSAGRPETAPPVRIRMDANEIVRAINTADTTARADMVSSFLSMSPEEQAATIALIRGRAQPLEARASALEAEARRLEEPIRARYDELMRLSETAETEGSGFSRQMIATDTQIAEARRAGNAPEEVRLTAEKARLDSLWTQRMETMRSTRAEADRLMQPANALRGEASGLRQQASYWNDSSMYYRELRGLTGDIGTYLSSRYGVPRDELTRAYSSGPDLAEARRALYGRMGIRLGELPDSSVRSDAYKSFNSLADDPYISGMILTGDLLRNVESIVRPEIDASSLRPGDRIVVREIDFQNGLVGAYRLTIEVVDSTGAPRTFRDVTGRERTSVTLFAKRQGLEPDARGSEARRISGAPAPDIITEGQNGTQFRYTSPEGQTIEYGIMRDMRDFHGDIWAGGQRINVSIDAAEDLYSLPFDSSNPRTTQARESLFGEMRDHPDQFIESLGYAQTGFMMGGFYDNHEGNVWTNWLRIRNTPPAEAGRIARNLESQGYRVRQNPDHSYSFFRDGGIDSDSFGSYRASRNPDGTMNFTPMVNQYVTDLHRVFVHLTYEFNKVEVARAQAEGRSPRLLTVEQVTERAFGANMDGPWVRGMRRWLAEFNPSTPQGREYRDAMLSLFNRTNGRRAGMGFAMEGSNLGRFERDGYLEIPSALNGMPATYLDGMDGRSSFMAEGRMASNPTITEPANRRAMAAIPEGRISYLVRLDGMGRAERTQFDQAVGSQRPGTFRTSPIEGRRYAIFTDMASIPEAFRGRVTAVGRRGETLFTYNLGDFNSVLPEGRAVYILPLEGIGRSDARRLGAIPGTRRLELGVGGDRAFLVFSSRESIPEAQRSGAVMVRRRGQEIMGESGIATRLGIVNSQEVGARIVFDTMMGMGDPGMTDIWTGVRDGVLRQEATARANQGADFLVRRVPDTNARNDLPPEYGGPPRTQVIAANPPPLPQPAVAPQPVPVGPGGTQRGVATPPPAPAPRATLRDATPPPVRGQGPRGTQPMGGEEQTRTRAGEAPAVPSDQARTTPRVEPSIPREAVRSDARPPSVRGAAPSERSEAAELAGGIIRGDPNASTRFNGSTPEMRTDVGFEIAGELRLANATDLAAFARDVVLYNMHQSGQRPITDPAVLARVERSARLFALLPEAPPGRPSVKGTVTRLTTDAGFQLNATDDARFGRYVGNRRIGGAVVEAARGEIIRAMP